MGRSRPVSGKHSGGRPSVPRQDGNHSAADLLQPEIREPRPGFYHPAPGGRHFAHVYRRPRVHDLFLQRPPAGSMHAVCRDRQEFPGCFRRRDRGTCYDTMAKSENL